MQNTIFVLLFFWNYSCQHVSDCRDSRHFWRGVLRWCVGSVRVTHADATKQNVGVRKKSLHNVNNLGIYGSLCTQTSPAHLFRKRHPSVQQFDSNSSLVPSWITGETMLLPPQCISVVLTSVFAQACARNWTWQLWIHSTSLVTQLNKACAGAFSLSPNSFFHAFRQCDLRLEDTHHFSGGDTVKNKHRLTDAQTYVGLPSTSVTVRCFFMSACFTVTSLSSGLTSSRLRKKKNWTFFPPFFFSLVTPKTVLVAETRTVFWTSCRFTSVQLQLSGSQPLQRCEPEKIVSICLHFLELPANQFSLLKSPTRRKKKSC